MTYTRYAVNTVLNSLLPSMRDIGIMYACPQRKVKTVVKSWTNGAYPIAVAWLGLECGHTAKALHAADRPHDESGHLIKAGDTVGCQYCARYDAKLTQIKELQPGDLQHARFRTRDSRGFGPGDYYLYVRDPKGPTGVRLLLSVEVTPAVETELSRLRATALSPTEAR